jgi:hypothetical protein
MHTTGPHFYCARVASWRRVVSILRDPSAAHCLPLLPCRGLPLGPLAPLGAPGPLPPEPVRLLVFAVTL